MISRSRSAPTALAMSIEWTTSANRTVTCLYSADRFTGEIGVAHWWQNFESGGSCVPQEVHDGPVVVNPTPLGPRQYRVTAEGSSKSYRAQSPELDVRVAKTGRWRV